MKRAIIIGGIALVFVIGIFIYFTSSVSSVYPPIKKYEYLGNMRQLTSRLQDFTSLNSNVTFIITDTVGNDNNYGLYLNIKIKDNNRNISYELKCENNNRELSKTKIELIGAHDETNKAGGYRIDDPEVKALLNYFDSQFLTELETKEHIKITPL